MWEQIYPGVPELHGVGGGEGGGNWVGCAKVTQKLPPTSDAATEAVQRLNGHREVKKHLS